MYIPFHTIGTVYSEDPAVTLTTFADTDLVPQKTTGPAAISLC